MKAVRSDWRRSKRRIKRVAQFALAAGIVTLLGAAAVGGSAVAKQSPFAVVTTFTAQAEFPEGLALGRDGNLYVSVTNWKALTGRVVRVSPNGAKTAFGPTFRVGTGLLTGVAFDAAGRLYVAAATSRSKPAPATTPAPGVFRIDSDGSSTRVLRLPEASFPNGLAFAGGRLYVSDSTAGAIWCVSSDGQRTLWLKHSLLAPKHDFGANGLVFRQNSLYVAVSDAGRIVRIPIRPNGSAGTPVVVAQRPLLRTVDGIAFDGGDHLYAVTNTNRLLRLGSDGDLAQLAGPRGLAYPTSPAFGTARSTKTTLYVVNGALEHGTPGIVSFHVASDGTTVP